MVHNLVSCRSHSSKYSLRCLCDPRDVCVDGLSRKDFNRCWKDLIRKTFTRGRKTPPPLGTPRSQTISDQNKKPRKRIWRSVLRRGAKRSLSRRFSPASSVDASQKTYPAGISHLGPVRAGAKASRISNIVRIAGSPKAAKLYARALRRVLADLGCALLGPFPTLMLQRVWDVFGERLIAPHGMSCWCALCRSKHVAVYRDDLEAFSDLVVSYVKQMPLSVAMGLIIPAPLKTAKFVANKLWKWAKVLFPGYTASLSRGARSLWEKLIKSWKDWFGSQDAVTED